MESQPELDWDDLLTGRERLLRVVDEETMRQFVELGSDVIVGRTRAIQSRCEPPQLKTTIERSIEPPQTKGSKLTIALAHSNLGQFRHLHEYLNRSGLATSNLFCSEANFRKHSRNIPNLVPFKPHGGRLSDPKSFYYLTRIEGANRRSLGLRNALRRLQERTAIDVFVGYVTAGSPSMLFDEAEFPIVTCLEYPSFRCRGWEACYPPTAIKGLRDKNLEMLTCHAVLKSDHSIVPSVYARNLFPRELWPKISVLMEGFPFDSDDWSRGGILQKQDGMQYIGFAARDLTSAKGFQQFVRIANRVGEFRPNVHFVVLGGDNVLYSYENHFLDTQLGPKHGRTFRDWILDHEQTDRSRFTFPGLLPYQTFSRYINDIDLFLYQLQFGSANWGLFELLGRGKIVIASNRCYLPEVITHGVNGLLCDYDDLDAWARVTIEILNDLAAHRGLGDTARRMSLRFSIDRVASEFVALWTQLVRRGCNSRRSCISVPGTLATDIS